MTTILDKPMYRNIIIKLYTGIISLIISGHVIAGGDLSKLLTPEEQCENSGLIDFSGNLENSINDVSLLNETSISCIIQPITVETITKIVTWSYQWNALNTDKKVGLSVSGTKHSQGGHIANAGGITLDLSRLNQVFEPTQINDYWQVDVQAGALWGQVHDVIKQYDGLSLVNKVQQSSTPFSVGGTLAVNAHGRNFNYGSIIHSIRSIRIVLPSGELISASRAENSDIFRAAIGGYGLIGIIVEATLELLPNHRLSVTHESFNTVDKYIDYITHQLKDVDRGEVIRGEDAAIVNERLSPVSYLFATVSLDESNFLTGINSYIYKQVHAVDNTGWSNPDPEPRLFNKAWFTQIGFGLKRKGYFVNTSQKFQHGFLLKQDTRLKILTPPIKPILAAGNSEEPDLLQEYFIPIKQLPEFVNSIRQVFKQNETILSNVSIRFIPKSIDRSTISYVSETEDQFAIVLYFSIKLDKKSIMRAGRWTRTLVQSALDLGGRHYLPYQRWPTKDQVESGYPMLDEFIELKKRYDPYQTFTNQFYQNYLSGY